MKQVQLSAAQWATPRAAHEALKEALSFPDYYGHNLDALHDCLTEMKKRGLQRAWAQSTPIASSATHVYEKAGFVRTGEYIIFRKAFSEG